MGREVGLSDATGLEVALADATGLEVALADATGLEVALADATGQGQGREMGPTGPEVGYQSSLPDAIVYRIARLLAPWRRSVEAMRAVCRQWRDAVPPTRAPCLVLSPKDVRMPTVLLRIENQGVFVRHHPLFPPPRKAYCWSCSRGLMALRVPETNGYRLCVNCGRQEDMAHLPEHLHLTNVSETWNLVCAFSAEGPMIFWSRHGDNEWSPFDYGLGIEPKSLCWNWEDGIACIAAAPSSLIVDALFEERLLPVPVDQQIEELVHDEPGVEHQHPAPAPVVIDFVLDIPLEMAPWQRRGHHVFHLGLDTYVCVLLRHTEDQHAEVRLFVLDVDADGDNGAMLPAHNIGNHALFIGANQAFATAAGLGVMPNTAYVVDDDGVFQAPRVLAIHLSTGQQAILSYPDDSGDLHSFMPPSWLAALPDADLERHCNSQ